MNDLEPEISYHFTRSQGAGGQNVNKVNTRAELRFNVLESVLLSEEEKEKILQNLSSRISKRGELRLSSQRARSQVRNRQLVTDRFYELLENALKDKIQRIATKPTRASAEKRIKMKKLISEIKQSRKKPVI
jgi:ribosome-associated protein